MEIELHDIQSLQAREKVDLGSQQGDFTPSECNSISNRFSSASISSGQEFSSQKKTAVVLIDGNTFVVRPVGFGFNLFYLD